MSAKRRSSANVPAGAGKAKHTRKKVLHIGCGAPDPQKLHSTFRSDAWQEIRVDIDARVKPDIVADMTDLSMLKTGEAHAIWSSHNIEHLYAHEVPLALAEFYRVICDGGFVMLNLPDIQAVAPHIARGNLEGVLYNSPAGSVSPLDIVFGFSSAVAKGNHYMTHKTAFTAETLGMKLKMAGFSNIQVQRKNFDLWALAYKLPKNFPKRSDKIVIVDPSRTSGQGKAQLPDELDRLPTPVKRAAPK